jgi:class 3 adenylate cyclase
LLDKVYDGIDNLCDQFALEKIMTAGNTYIACGGLKVCEAEVDPRLLGNHHSVRVSDFACSVLSFVNSITLKDGAKANIRVGIHTGDAVLGILGDTKP